jgi:predicted RNA-binding Zn-ribbon protein involved in translation (DUF1610 family)
MSRVTCRCGETISVKSSDGPERVDCPKCGARIRLRRKSSQSALAPASPLTEGASESDDGYIRFYCPCGRRLKVRAEGGRREGKCPDCGRLVPVPGSVGTGAGGRSGGRVDPDARTADLDAYDIARLEEWSQRHTGRSPETANGPDDTPTGVPQIRVGPPPFGEAAGPSVVSFEAGLRVCPRCGKPVHISATACRECGAAVPRR